MGFTIHVKGENTIPSRALVVSSNKKTIVFFFSFLFFLNNWIITSTRKGGFGSWLSSLHLKDNKRSISTATKFQDFEGNSP